MSDGQEVDVWNRCDEVLGFPNGPQVCPPSQFVTWNVASLFLYKDDAYNCLENDLRSKTLKALQRCTAEDEEIYGLDWNHTCYFWQPHAVSNELDLEAWAVPVYPDRDHYFFLAKDFRFGIFANCIESSILVFGQNLLDAFDADPPKLFDKRDYSVEEKNSREQEWLSAGWRELETD